MSFDENLVWRSEWKEGYEEEEENEMFEEGGGREKQKCRKKCITWEEGERKRGRGRTFGKLAEDCLGSREARPGELSGPGDPFPFHSSPRTHTLNPKGWMDWRRPISLFLIEGWARKGIGTKKEINTFLAVKEKLNFGGNRGGKVRGKTDKWWTPTRARKENIASQRKGTG